MQRDREAEVCKGVLVEEEDVVKEGDVVLEEEGGEVRDQI